MPAASWSGRVAPTPEACDAFREALARHREALAHLLYGLNSDGAFILLTGDVGTGKTTVSRCLLEQIPDQTSLALVLNPKLSAIELLETIKAYLLTNVIHVEIVLEVALIAIARKVIILDLDKYESLTLVGIAALIAAVALAFLVIKLHIKPNHKNEH